MTDPVLTPVPGEPRLLLGAYRLDDLGYTAQEFFVSGTASSYGSAGESLEAEYTTRIVVISPADRSEILELAAEPAVWDTGTVGMS